MDSSKQPPLPPVLVLIFGILAVSTASLFIRFAQEYASSLVIATYRLGLASLVLAPLAYARYRSETIRLSRRELCLALFSGFFLALHFATWITSLEYTSVASSVVLVTTTPIWVALFSPFTIKEAISRIVKLGMLIALIGGAIVTISDSCVRLTTGWSCPGFADFLQGKAFLGDLLALTGAVMGAAYILIGSRFRRKLSLISYIFLVYGMAALVLLTITLGARQSLTGYPSQAYFWLILLALIPQLLGHTTFNWALRYISAGYVSTALLGEPIGSSLLALIFLGEAPSLLKIFGAGLILAGISIASRGE